MKSTRAEVQINNHSIFLKQHGRLSKDNFVQFSQSCAVNDRTAKLFEDDKVVFRDGNMHFLRAEKE